MDRLIATLLLVLVLGAYATEAFACRVYLPIACRIKNLHDRNVLQGIVLARVIEAAQGPAPTGERLSWTGKIEVIQTLNGKGDIDDRRIGRTGSSAACDDGIPLPKIGDFWVLYLIESNGKIGGSGYPVEVAEKADPCIGPLLSRRPR